MVSSVAVVAGIGNGSGTGAAVARLFAQKGYTVALISRGPESLDAVAKTIRESGGVAESFPVSGYGADDITTAFASVHARFPAPDYAVTVAIFNAGHGVWKPFLDITPEDIKATTTVNIEGAFAFSRAAIVAFQKNELGANGARGTLIFSGATASLRGNVRTSAFASGKFALRALSQSLAKEFGKQNIHVSHAIIDGGISTANAPIVNGTRGQVGAPSAAIENTTPDSRISPEALADAYLYLVNQDRSVWTWELDVRPAHENW